MALTINYDINLDLIRNNYVAIRIKQYDDNTRTLTIHCTSNGQEFKLEEGMQALIQVKKPDGHSVSKTCVVNVEDNTITADISRQMSTTAGVGYADVCLFDSTNTKTLGTMKFNVVIDTSAITKEDIISSDEFDTLTDLVIYGQQKIQELIDFTNQAKQEHAQHVAAEEERKQNEQVRQEKETERQSAETARDTAETKRVEAENLRKTAETAREETEASRVEAESSRVQAESSRVTAENERSEAESSRVSAESARVEEEKRRVQAESSRASAESSRAQVESERVTAETQRKQNEEARQSAETARSDAENSRASAESGRVSAEKSRVTEEGKRVEAEAARASAEQNRQSKEQERQTAEKGRVEAEKGRETAETGRVSAESKRQTDTAAAIQECSDIKRVIESKLENGEFNGNTVLLGSNEPSPEMGKDGDIYIDIAGIGSYPHYLFTKGNGYWTPQWSMRGLNGKVVDSLLSDSIENAPSVRAVKEGLAGKVVDNLNGEETDVAPSVRVVKEKFNTKADKIMQLSTAGVESKDVKLGLKKTSDSNINNVQMIDRNGNTNLFPITLWDLINNKPSLATLVNGKLPIANIPYSPLDFKDVGGNLALDVTVQNLTFELWGVSKKLNYTSEYEAGKYVKIGNIIFFSFYWKGSVKEAGEYARVKMNVLDLYPPLIEMSVVVSQWTFILSGSPVDITGTVTPAPNPRLVVAHTNGGPAAIWGTGTGQYFKASGCYITG